MLWIIVGSLIGYFFNGSYGLRLGGELGFALLVIFELSTISEKLSSIESDVSSIEYDVSSIESSISSIKSNVSSIESRNY